MRKQLVLAALLVAAPFAAPAQPLSYTYVEAGYLKAEQELPGFWGGNLQSWRPDDLDGDGFHAAASFAVSEPIYLFGRYERVTDTVALWRIGHFDNFNYSIASDATASRWQLGFGYRYAVSEGIDLLAEAGVLSYDVELTDNWGGFEASGNNLRVSVGTRAAVAGPVELWAKANYTNGDDERDAEFSGSVGLQYKFTPHVGIVGEYEGGDGYAGTQYRLGVRASF